MIDGVLQAELMRSFGAAFDDDDASTVRRELLAAGWLDALEADAEVAIAVVFRLQGSRHCDAACLDDVVAATLRSHLSAPAGQVAVAYPIADGADADADVSHVVLHARPDAQQLVWMDGDGEAGIRIIDLDAELGAETDAHRVDGIDPAFGLLGIDQPPSGKTTTLADADEVRDAVAWGRTALAHQTTAGAHALLVRATEHARARHQFGSPIGSFQAVKHRLADTYAAVCGADAAAIAAGGAVTRDRAALAKALAGRAASIAARNCLQVFGGIGFTTEHEFHRYFRRNLVLDRLLGTTRALETEIGAAVRHGARRGDRVVDLAQVPRVDPLPAPPVLVPAR